MKTINYMLAVIFLLIAVPGHVLAIDYHAVLAGINDYSNWYALADLKYAVNDVTDIRLALINHLGWKSENINIKTDGNATKSAIETAIEAMPQVDGDDTSLFYFSGHGDPTNGLNTYSCYDYITPGDLLNYFNVGVGYNQFACFLDACYSGIFADNMNRGVICVACDDDETAKERDALENGVYTEFVLEGIVNSAADPDYIVTVQDVHNYADPRTTQEESTMHPKIKDNYYNDLLLTSVMRKDSGNNIEGRYTTVKLALAGASSGDKVYMEKNTYEDTDFTIPSNVTVYTSYRTMKFADSVELIVNGTLNANGSAAFTKDADAASWDGIKINSGGTFLLGGDVDIEYATTGLTIDGNSSTPISNVDRTLNITNCTTGLHMNNCTPTVQNISFTSITNDAIVIHYLTSDPTIDKVTINDGEYGIDIHSGADATLTNSVLYSVDEDNIYFENGAGIDMNGGHNDVYRTSGKYAIDNARPSTVFINVNYNYWDEEENVYVLFSDPSVVTCTEFDDDPNEGGAYKKAAFTIADMLRTAREYEHNGLYDLALDIYRQILTDSVNKYERRKAFKRMVHIHETQGCGFDDIVSLMESELKSAEGWYRAYLDCALCDIMVKEGRYHEAVKELELRSAHYTGTSVEVMMLAEIANIYGSKLGDTRSAALFADKAAAINPGESSLRIAYSAAGIDYDASRYEDRFAGKIETFDIAPDSDQEKTVEKTAPSVSISPNPANPSTTINYTIVQPGNVSLAVYSVSGQKLANLVDGFMPAGTHTAVFDGSSLASGLYLYRFEAAGFAKTGKIMLVK